MADRYLFWTKLIAYTFTAKAIPKVSENVKMMFAPSPIVGHLDYTQLSSWILIASLGFLDSWRSASEPHVTPISPIYMDVKNVFIETLNAQIKNEKENVPNKSSSSNSTNSLRIEDSSLLKHVTQRPLFWLLYSLFNESLVSRNNDVSLSANSTIGYLNLLRIGCIWSDISHILTLITTDKCAIFTFQF